MINIIIDILFYISIFAIVFLLQFGFSIKPNLKKNKEKEKKIIELEYLSKKFNIPKEKLLNSVIGTKICYINAFIITVVSMIILNIPVAYYIQLLIGFIILMVMIYGIYEIFGKILVKEIKNEL